MATILIADDASFMRGTLKYIVENAHHKVVGTAKEGKEAVEMYTRLKPDLVLLDILMEGVDGIAALKAIRKHDPEAKVVMVTALGQEHKRQEAQQLGASGYIRKPFKQEEIADEINRILSNGE